VTDCKNFYLLLALATLFSSHPLLRAQERRGGEPVLQMCSEYSRAGDLLKASVSAHSFVLSIARQTGQVADLAGRIPEVVTISQLASSIVPCQLVVSATSDRAALAIPTANGIILELIDLTAGKLTHMVRVPNKFPIQFSLHPVGFVDESSQLAVSQAHYLPTGEPEVATVLVSSDGSITSVPHNVLGAQYTEVSSSSFDFRGGRVWFLCPAYSARIDRQPRCTLTSAPLFEASAPHLEISPPPDDRVIGSGQPNLGFLSSDEVILLAQGRVWLYHFSDRSFHQMNLPETPHHIRWFEFPGQPKFSSDGRFAAVPVYMSHAPLFQEGQVPHGTKLVILELPALSIVKTIQPPDGKNLVDFALYSDGSALTLAASWGNGWQSFQIPIASGSGQKSVGADAATTTH
jgi:hypothetical protein